MKFIPYREFQGIKTRDILAMVASQGGGNAVRADDMRKRVRILDALDRDEKGPGLVLEDADHAVLRSLVADFPFSGASRDLLTIIDDVLDAKAPVVVQQPEAAKPKAA